MSGQRKQVGCQVKGEIAECWCCYSLEMSLLPDWDQCSRFDPRAGSVMLRLPLVPPRPGVPASPGGFSGGVLATCPWGLSIILTPLQHRQLGLTAEPSPVCPQAGNSPKVVQKPPHPTNARHLGDLPGGSALPLLAGGEEGRKGPVPCKMLSPMQE